MIGKTISHYKILEKLGEGGMGNNTWAGGENTSDYSSVFFLPNATLKVDGKTVVKNGVLK